VLSASFWHEADIEEARIGATPNVRFAATSLKGRLAAEGVRREKAAFSSG
jgi:hypothetical protein